MIIGIIGCGNIAKAHIKALSKINNVASILLYDTNENNVHSASEVSSKPIFIKNNISEIVGQSDGIIICTPNHTHEMIIKEISTLKDIPIVCEKPLSTNIDSAYRICEVANKKSIISFNYRYNKLIEAIINIIGIYEFGKINYFYASFNKDSALRRKHLTWRDTADQNASSGALGDLSCHLIDLFTYISKQDVLYESVRVSKDTAVKEKAGGLVSVDDNGYIFGVGENGCIFKIKASKVEKDEPKGLHLNLIFENGEIKYTPEKSNEINVKLFSSENWINHGVLDEHLIPDPENEVSYWSDSFYSMLNEWCRLIKENESFERLPLISKGVNVQLILENI